MDIKPSDMKPAACETRESLLLRLRDGRDQEAWREFYDMYGRLIFGYALHFDLAYSEAEDIVQEVCIKVFRHIGALEYSPARGSFRGWLKTVTRHAVVDYLRRKRHRSKTSKAYRNEVGIQTGAEDDIWRKEWEKALYEVALERVRKRVGEETFHVFNRYVLGNASAREAAEGTALEPNAVYAVRHRMLRYIREEVDQLIENE